ncbi:MAG TPA: bifunctional DNA-binding transcriptional regulator/O6-methylguanine-DNA methyltransferase Ada [Roseiflexaceae bacterium]|nr:bifunctional DNA-binding transcriptional regulator/O6-methylguanine-DNA methyltransferase Ada [Roseiflexaceae bacterium]
MITVAVAHYTTDAARWEAIERRDRGADGAFVYGVRTTGVYCRPWCPSRRPRRDNVLLFDTCAGAERAGFRPCKRCDPAAQNRRDPHADAIVRACKRIEEAETAPSLRELAEEAGLSQYHFQRLFKAAVGLTPKQYALAHRQRRLRERLRQDATVTEALYNAGFESSGRFYAEGSGLLGMTPSEYRRGAPGQVIRAAVAPCYLGWALVAATGRGVCAIEFGDEPEALRERLRARFPGAELREGDPEFAAWFAQVLAFIEAPRGALDVPLDIQGTVFQRRVWEALRALPPGATASYGQIAGRIGQPAATRAVAQACAANPLAVAIPCHRVLRGDGELGGYRWGVERKRALLARESET